MTRSVVDKNVYESDTVFLWILYAIREVPVETLGFSPFELLFGKNPREILTLIRDACTPNDFDVPTNKTNVVEYMLTLRDRFAYAKLQIKLQIKTQKSIKINQKIGMIEKQDLDNLKLANKF